MRLINGRAKILSLIGKRLKNGRFFRGMKIEKKSFYFIKNKYFRLINDPFLSGNKKDGNYRPCYLAVIEEKGLIWFVPISSRFEKYKRIYEYKLKRFGNSDTIVLGEVLGRKCAFLIQNIFPVTQEYIQKQYIQKNNGVPVTISELLSRELFLKCKKIIAMVRNGVKNIVFTNILEIENKLLSDLKTKNK